MNTSKRTVVYVATQLGLTQSKAEQLLDYASQSLMCMLRDGLEEVELGELGKLKVEGDKVIFSPSDKLKKFVVRSRDNVVQHGK